MKYYGLDVFTLSMIVPTLVLIFYFIYDYNFKKFKKIKEEELHYTKTLRDNDFWNLYSIILNLLRREMAIFLINDDPEEYRKIYYDVIRKANKLKKSSKNTITLEAELLWEKYPTVMECDQIAGGQFEYLYLKSAHDNDYLQLFYDLSILSIATYLNLKLNELYDGELTSSYELGDLSDENIKNSLEVHDQNTNDFSLFLAEQKAHLAWEFFTDIREKLLEKNHLLRKLYKESKKPEDVRNEQRILLEINSPSYSNDWFYVHYEKMNPLGDRYILGLVDEKLKYVVDDNCSDDEYRYSIRLHEDHSGPKHGGFDTFFEDYYKTDIVKKRRELRNKYSF